MSKRRTIVVAGFLLLLALAAPVYRALSPIGVDRRTVQPPSQTEPAPGRVAQSEGHAPVGGKQKASGRARSSVPVVTVPASIADFHVVRRTIGTIESPAAVVVRARIESQIVEQHVRDGEMVKKDDLLFTLDDRELQATLARDRAQLAKDQADLRRTELDLQRARELVQRNAAPQTQLEAATAANQSAAATVQADQAQIGADQTRLGYARMVSPMAGRIGAIRISPGNLVSASETGGVATITQMQPLRVSFSLGERDLAELRQAILRQPPARVRVYRPGEGEVIAEGSLDFVDTSVDVASGTIAARATFGNDDLALWPGQFVDVEIELSVRPQTIMLPTIAIQNGQKGPFVFVVEPDQTVRMRPVQPLASEGDKTALTAGVDRDERIVVEGQLRLVDGARVTESGDAREAVGPAGGRNHATTD